MKNLISLTTPFDSFKIKGQIINIHYPIIYFGKDAIAMESKGKIVKLSPFRDAKKLEKKGVNLSNHKAIAKYLIQNNKL